jgi:hypothetical protein
LSYFEDVGEGAGAEFTPAQALLASVLDRALQDFAGPGEGAQIRRYRNNARQWLFGAPSSKGGLHFKTVCEALNLQPDAVRKLVLAGRVQLNALAGRPWRHLDQQEGAELRDPNDEVVDGIPQAKARIA